MSAERFILQPSADKGWWVATDAKHQIVVKFQQGKFNETQQVTHLRKDIEMSFAEMMSIPRYLRELADWLLEKHVEVILT